MIESAEDLRTQIRALAEHEPDPARITHKILTSLTANEALVVAHVTLVEYVRRLIAHATMAPREMHESPASRDYATSDGRKSPSAATAAIRDWVSADLARAVNVAVEGREWKFLGKCDRDNCLTMASNRHRKAAEVVAEAERFERIAEALEEHGVTLVEDLPREVLEGLLRR